MTCALFILGAIVIGLFLGTYGGRWLMGPMWIQMAEEWERDVHAGRPWAAKAARDAALCRRKAKVWRRPLLDLWSDAE